MPLVILVLLPSASPAQKPSTPTSPVNPSIIYKVQTAMERLDMTVNTSRILTMEQKIPQAQVNNPDILELTPLSPNQIQVSAKAPGVTQINLWGEDQKLFTIDVIVYGDARELEMILRSTFPSAALKIVPVSNSILISGYVDRPEHIDRIVRIAEEYYPKVINNMTVGGVQQVLLHVRVMEVSRTKLRRLGFDFAKITGPNVIGSGIAGLLANSLDTSTSLTTGVASAAPNTFSLGVVDGNNAFFGFLDALRQDNLMKIMDDTTLVTVSGRAASFNSGGEIPVPVPQSLGTLSIEWKRYGTQLDFVPIVLGNGKIRLEVRPRISELDDARSITIQGTTVPGIKSRDADTGAELMAGQTLAIAGLIETRVEAQNRGLPWISEVPYLGVAFRRESEEVNEVELLMLVTPQLVEAMDANEVPQCGPGMQTTSPSDWELFMKGHLEVPKCCPVGVGCDRCQPVDGGVDDMPPDGMILGPGEAIPTPQPADAVGRPLASGRQSVAQRSSAARSGASRPYSRQSLSNPNASTSPSTTESSNSPPGFIGPVGYDVVK